MIGVEAVLSILSGANVRYIFGNPGSTELPMNNVLAGDSSIDYIFGLHELPITAMADGYAMASGELAVVCVHTCCGLGNAMGMLYNAWCAGTPVLMIAGQQDRRLQMEEPALTGDMVSAATPWTKWAMEASTANDAVAAVRRAIQIALTPPTGPVFLSLPVDVQMAVADGLDTAPPYLPDMRVRPSEESVKNAARILANAKNSVILAGSRVTESGAVKDLVQLAESMGARVFAEQQLSHGRLPMPSDHPLYAGPLPVLVTEVEKCLASHDVVFATGMNLLRLFMYQGSVNPFPRQAQLVQMDNDARQVAKNYPVALGIVCDLQAGMSDLNRRLSEILGPEQARNAAVRREASAAKTTATRDALQKEMDARRDDRPMAALTLMETLASALPADAVLVEESAATYNYVLEKVGFFKDPTRYFGHRGWALGWGIGCAMGVKLAWPDKPVVALVGDGAALYSIQGLWTASHYRLPVTFIVANNAQYKILKLASHLMNYSNIVRNDFPAMDIVDPEIDFTGLACSFGVEALRVATPTQLADHLNNVAERTTPILLDVQIER